MMSNLTNFDYQEILSGSNLTQAKMKLLIESIISVSSVTEGSGAPSHSGIKHSWYFDTATSKYYRNTDGGTTWVALN